MFGLIEVEEDLWPQLYIVGFASLAAGFVVGEHTDFCTGFSCYMGVYYSVLLGRQVWLAIWLPDEARRAARLVGAWFREQFPEELVGSVAVRAIETERYVISVHGLGRPPSCRYFA